MQRKEAGGPFIEGSHGRGAGVGWVEQVQGRTFMLGTAMIVVNSDVAGVLTVCRAFFRAPHRQHLLLAAAL